MEKPTESDQRVPHATQDEQLLESPSLDEFTHTDTWRVFRIMGEFVEGFDELASLTRGISIFGSARTRDERSVLQTGAGNCSTASARRLCCDHRRRSGNNGSSESRRV